MAGNIAFYSGIDNNIAPAEDTAGNTRDTHLLTAFLNGTERGFKTQLSLKSIHCLLKHRQMQIGLQNWLQLKTNPWQIVSKQ